MALSQDSILGSFLPTIYTSKIMLLDTKVSLELVVIDTLEDEEMTSIINDGFLRDCIKIKINQSHRLSDGTEQENNPFIDGSISISLADSKRTEIDGSGNKKYYYDVDYNIDTSNIRDLIYEVSSDIDPDSIRSKYGIKLSGRELQSIPRKVSVDKVIEEYELVSKSYIYQLLDGSIWRGEVVSVGTTGDTFQTLEDAPRRLNEIEIPNYKIQDFRIRKEIQKNSTSQEFTDQANLLIERTSPHINIPISSPSYFPVVESLVNTDKTVSISILIDTNKIIRENCLYPLLLQDNISSESLISGFSLIRRQINSVSNNMQHTLIETEDNTIPESIVSGFKKHQIKTNSEYTHLLLTDEGMKNITSGKYQYGIQFKFMDPTIAELKKRLISVLSVRKNIVEYYSYCQAYINPQTEYFKDEIRDLWSEASISDHVGVYIDCLIDVDIDQKNKLRTSLTTHISPVAGSLDGIAIFIKMLDDLIYDIGNMLSVSGVSTDISEINASNIDNFTAKPSAEFERYFTETIYDASKFNKIKISYFNQVHGIVDAKEFSSRLYENSKNGDALYVSPKLVHMSDDIIDLDILQKEQSVLGRKHKYILLKNKILNITKTDDLYSGGKDVKFLLQNNTRNKPVSIRKIIQKSNDLIEDYLFSQNSITFENLPSNTTSIDKLDSIDEVLYPKNTKNISNESTDVNILQNRTIDLNSDEDVFRYRLLNKIVYCVTDKETSSVRWDDLTLDIINKYISKGRGRGTNDTKILCALQQYDYNKIDLDIANINNFDYNNKFILSLDGFAFTRIKVQTNISPQQPLPSPSPSPSPSRSPSPSPSPSPAPSPPPQFTAPSPSPRPLSPRPLSPLPSFDQNTIPDTKTIGLNSRFSRLTENTTVSGLSSDALLVRRLVPERTAIGTPIARPLEITSMLATNKLNLTENQKNAVKKDAAKSLTTSLENLGLGTKGSINQDLVNSLIDNQLAAKNLETKALEKRNLEFSQQEAERKVLTAVHNNNVAAAASASKEKADIVERLRFSDETLIKATRDATTADALVKSKLKENFGHATVDMSNIASEVSNIVDKSTSTHTAAKKITVDRTSIAISGPPSKLSGAPSKLSDTPSRSNISNTNSRRR